MMRVLLHLDLSAPATLLGIWAPPERAAGTYRRFYPEPTAAEAAAEEFLTSVDWCTDWDRLVSCVCDMLPYGIWWEPAQVPDDAVLCDVFDSLAAKVFASAATTHSKASGSAKYHAAMLTPAQEALIEARTPGEAVAAALGVPAGRVSTRRLSSQVEWFCDDDRLLVVAPDPDRPSAVEVALAHGLAYAGDRDLWLAVPAGLEGPTLRRVAFLEPRIRVWTHIDGVPTEQIVPARSEVLARLNDPLGVAEAQLDYRREWIAALLAWAADAPRVVTTPTSQYVGYQCAGRMVLKIRPVGTDRLAVSAGVHHTKADAPLTVTLGGPASPADVHRLVAAAASACASRLAGTDSANSEHRLQSQLDARALGLLTMRREFPARRPTLAAGSPSLGGDGRGFIDFLGVDSRGRLHVVEVKIGGDDNLILQGLDYWTWTVAHRTQLAEHFGLDKTPSVCLDFVVGPKTPGASPFGPYSAAQAEGLLGEIPWRFHLATTMADGTVELTAGPSRTVPDSAPRRAAPIWSRRIGAHLAGVASDAGHVLHAGVFYPSPTDGLSDAARLAHGDLVVAGLDHRMVGHVRSSQAFALNLFAGLDEPGRLAVLRRVGISAVACEPAAFEVSDPADRLWEKTVASPHATQIDVVLRATDNEGARHMALIEVKLSETDFGHCSAFQSDRNPDRTVCGQPHPFGGDTASCFQLRNHDRGPRRRYDQVLGPITSQPSGNGCWWRLGASQPMRNVALARQWIAAGEADTAVVSLCAPLAHRAIWRRWHEAQAVLASDDKVRLADLPADCVAQYRPDGPILAARYLLDEQAARRMAKVRRWQDRLDHLFPAGAALEADTDTAPIWPLVVRRPLVVDVDNDRPAIWLNPVAGFYIGGMWSVETATLCIQSTDRGNRLQLRPAPGERWLVDPELLPDTFWIEGRPPRLDPSEEPLPELDFIKRQHDR